MANIICPQCGAEWPDTIRKYEGAGNLGTIAGLSNLTGGLVNPELWN